MGSPSVIRGDVQFTGKVTFADDVVLPNEVVGNESIDSDSPLDTSKTIHRFVVPYRQNNGANIAAATFALATLNNLNGGRISRITATITGVKATGDRQVSIAVSSVSTPGGSPAAIADTVMLDAATDLYDPTDITITDDTTLYAQGTTFICAVTVSGSTGTQPQGLLIEMQIDQEPE